VLYQHLPGGRRARVMGKINEIVGKQAVLTLSLPLSSTHPDYDHSDAHELRTVSHLRWLSVAIPTVDIVQSVLQCTTVFEKEVEPEESGYGSVVSAVYARATYGETEYVLVKWVGYRTMTWEPLLTIAEETSYTLRHLRTLPEAVFATQHIDLRGVRNPSKLPVSSEGEYKLPVPSQPYVTIPGTALFPHITRPSLQSVHVQQYMNNCTYGAMAAVTLAFFKHLGLNTYNQLLHYLDINEDSKICPAVMLLGKRSEFIVQYTLLFRHKDESSSPFSHSERRQTLI